MNMKTLMTTVFVALSATMVNAELMLTEWGAKVTSENALREYPRPQMERKNWTCLNGDWDYAITPIVDAPVRPGKWDGKIRVPFALDFVKKYDPTRLVDGPSGWSDWDGGDVHPPRARVFTTQHRPEGECEPADAVDYHIYRGPGMPRVNDRRVSFLGEFGGLGHPVEGHIWRAFDPAKSLGGKHTGDWGYGGIEDTKTREGLEGVYLGMMRKLGELAEKGLGGSVYTQTTDVEIEINGLLTYDRKVLKFNPAALRKAHDEVIVRFMKSATGK